MIDLIGHYLGQYKVTELLGRGGMATVYEGRQAIIERDVAIKVIQADPADMDEFVRLFNREAKAVASLSHPHILKIFDYGRQDSTVYLVMELHKRGSLDKWVRTSPLSLNNIQLLLDQLASALTYAHQQGIIHRDLKPQNILLDTHGNAILTDFGIAKLLNQTTTFSGNHMLMGTPAYMAPEAWRGEGVTVVTDIYALGIVLFELLAGRVPYTGDTPSVIMYQHLQAMPPSIYALRQDLPSGLDSIIKKALHKDPTQRFQSAVELSAAFQAALAQESSSVRRAEADVSTTRIQKPPVQIRTLEAPTSVSQPIEISNTDAKSFAENEKIYKPLFPVLGVALACCLGAVGLSGLVALRLIRTGSSELNILGLAVGIGTCIIALTVFGLFRIKRLNRIVPLFGAMTLLATIVFGTGPLINTLTDNLVTQAQQSVRKGHAFQTSDLLRALAVINPDRARQLVAEFNDDGVAANAHNNLTLAHSYLEAIRTFDTDNVVDVGRDKIIKSISRYNLGELHEAESDLPGAITVYREAIALDDANLDARYALSSLLLINQSQAPNALDNVVTIANLGWKNYIPASYCHGSQNLQDSETFQKTWYCFALKTTEAGARLDRKNTENGDANAVIESLSRSAVNLARENGNFQAAGYFTAEAYYYLAKVTAPATTEDTLCGILANIDGTNPRHRLWADYANQQLTERHLTCAN